ncbi:MAG TPA: DUF4149 domain-containing protein [Nitrospira sp.]|nr:DUF4149 domain-containing protein [Nitrospira sp.]
MSFSSAVVLSLHLLAAVSWIGGMVFLSLVLAPVIRKGGAPDGTALFRRAALRFRFLVWTAIAVLLVTGPFLALQRGIVLSRPEQWPSALLIKILLVACLLLMTALHDFVLGPLIGRIHATPAANTPMPRTVLLRLSRWVPRLALVLALGVLTAAALLTRS